MPISRRRKVSQVISVALDARDRYSASTLDLKTIGCRFEDHEIQLAPRKIQYPDVLLLVFMHPAQSASQKPVRQRELCLKNPIPCSIIPFKHLRMRLTARKSALVGAWKCWQALFTACTISGLVKVKY